MKNLLEASERPTGVAKFGVNLGEIVRVPHFLRFGCPNRITSRRFHVV